jgi:uncharacterized protein
MDIGIDPTGAARAAADSETVRRVYAAFEEGRPEAVAPLLAADIVLRQPPGHPEAGDHVGRTAALASLARTYEAVGSSGSTVGAVTADGLGTVVVLAVMRWPDGSTLEVLELLRVRDGLVAEFRPFFWDLARLRERAGWEGRPEAPLPPLTTADGSRRQSGSDSPSRLP